MAGSRARVCTAQKSGCRQHVMWESGVVLEPGLTKTTITSGPQTAEWSLSPLHSHMLGVVSLHCIASPQAEMQES